MNLLALPDNFRLRRYKCPASSPNHFRHHDCRLRKLDDATYSKQLPHHSSIGSRRAELGGPRWRSELGSRWEYYRFRFPGLNSGNRCYGYRRSAESRRDFCTYYLFAIHHCDGLNHDHHCRFSRCYPDNCHRAVWGRVDACQ